jgi:opacity protein-like surface antigen
MKQPLLALLLVVSCAGSAFAQTTARPRSAPPAKTTVGFRAYGVFDVTAVAASKSFDALFGSSQLFGGGGGAEIDVWHRLFLRIAVTYVQRSGSRVFVDDAGQVYPLNIPLTVTMMPIEAGAGWRFKPKNPKSRVTPYIGGAFVSLGYQETSPLAQAADAVNERYVGAAGFGGVDVAIAKHFFIGGEAQYRHIGVPDVSTSVMTQLGDKDLGGLTGRVLVGFRTK